jgi:hypothetical protein
MSAAAAQLAVRARTGAWRLAVTWVLLLAFALQSYITQTHVHPAAASGHAPAVQLAGKALAQRAPPAGDEALACPLCQAIAAAGTFLAPGLASARAPAALVLLVSSPASVAGIASTPAGFAWRSRAPPQP